MIDFDKLKAKFPPKEIEWRVGKVSKDGKKAIALAYIDARMVMDRLDEVCGPEGWQCRYSFAHPSSVSYSETILDKYGKPNVKIAETLGKTICEIGILVSGEWIWKSDGAGDTDFEGEKGAMSDAFKRAAVRWGIGRYLYEVPATWVAIDEFRNIIPSEIERLSSLVGASTVAVGISGLSKTPVKFWDNEKLTLSLPQRLMAVSGTQEALDWFTENLYNGINKAPTREKLAKFQADNQHILERLDVVEAEKIMEAFSIRADQLGE